MAEASTAVKSGVLRKFDIILNKNDREVEIMVDEKPRYEEVRKNAVENLTKILATFKEDKEDGMRTLDMRIQGLDKRIMDFYSEFHAMRKAFEDTLKQTETRMNDAAMRLEKRIEKERDFLMSDLSNIIAEAYDTAQVKPVVTVKQQKK